MASRKHELSAIKTTTGGNRYEERPSGKISPDQITVDPKNAVYIFYMLRSPEIPDVLKAIAALETFARKSPDNMRLLTELGIFEHLFPLLTHFDRVVKRFGQKLFGTLCSVEEFREIVLTVPNILQTFVDYLEGEMDEVMQEYISLTLAELSKDCQAASDLIRIENCIPTLFLRIKSFDPDIQKNCLDIMINLFETVNGVDTFIKDPSFNIKYILDLTISSYSIIQQNALEVLKQLTDANRDPTVMLAFRDNMGIEAMMDILETKDWADLHNSAIDVLTNATENEDLCDYILISGILGRLISLLDDEDEDKLIILRFIGILAKLSKTYRGRKALHMLAMDRRFVSLLNEANEKVQYYSCYAISNLSQYLRSLHDIMGANPTPRLMRILNDPNNSYCLKNIAAYTLSILCQAGTKAAESVLNSDKYEDLIGIIGDVANVPVDLCENIVQIFTGISLNEKLRPRLINRDLFAALLSGLLSDEIIHKKLQSLQVDILEFFSYLLLENEARILFNEMKGAPYLINCLHNKFAAVREWAAHVIVIMSQSEDFVIEFIREKGIRCLLREKNTIFTLPSWQSAIDAIFKQNLSAKFAYLGRLDLEDITKDGFFVFSNPCVHFRLLEEFFQSKINPLFPVYFLNFTNENLFPYNKASISEMEDSGLPSPVTSIYQKEMPLEGPKQKEKKPNCSGEIDVISCATTCLNVKVLEDIEMGALDFFIDTVDPYLSDYVFRLKKKIEKLENLSGDTGWECLHPQIIMERARIIAEFVADEMSGPNPDPSCNAHYKISHINEMKFNLGTHIIPLGFIRMGDYLERAMLFKALADRIGFPCTLVRGNRGRVWNEIAIPNINFEDGTEKNESTFEKYASSTEDGKNEDESQGGSGTFYESNDTNYWCEEGEKFYFPKLRMECFKPFPRNYLKPNAVVDLVDEPGRILLINSLEAQLYCGFIEI